MFLTSPVKIFFRKMSTAILTRVQRKQHGLYVYLAFPILTAFFLTFIVARIISHLAPEFFIEWSPGLHVHHFAYGFFILAIAGYLALIHSGPRAKYYISLLYGMGLGLAFDEFGMWLHLRDDDPTRLSYDGFTIVIIFFLIVLVAKPGLHYIKNLFFGND